jgi:hypothetical protein
LDRSWVGSIFKIRGCNSKKRNYILLTKLTTDSSDLTMDFLRAIDESLFCCSIDDTCDDQRRILSQVCPVPCILNMQKKIGSTAFQKLLAEISRTSNT